MGGAAMAEAEAQSEPEAKGELRRNNSCKPYATSYSRLTHVIDNAQGLGSNSMVL
jgi:hypothetical protein